MYQCLSLQFEHRQNLSTNNNISLFPFIHPTNTAKQFELWYSQKWFLKPNLLYEILTWALNQTFKADGGRGICRALFLHKSLLFLTILVAAKTWDSTLQVTETQRPTVALNFVQCVIKSEINLHRWFETDPDDFSKSVTKTINFFFFF